MRAAGALLVLFLLAGCQSEEERVAEEMQRRTQEWGDSVAAHARRRPPVPLETEPAPLYSESLRRHRDTVPLDTAPRP